jgi:phosphatidylglycerophosphate synthase
MRADIEHGGFLSQAERVRQLYTRERALRWSYAVNYRVGAIVAVALLPTRVSANAVTVSALVVNAAGAALVLLIDPPASAVQVAAILAVWQLAYSLDCADGLLARARGEASPFGAWLDQVMDFVGHTLAFGSLAVFLARALPLSGAEAAAVAAVAVAGSVLQLFAASQRNSLLGTAPAVAGRPPRWLRLASFGQQLGDYGLYLLVGSLLLLAPWALLVLILAFSAFTLVAVTAQVALNWIAYARRARAD